MSTTPSQENLLYRVVVLAVYGVAKILVKPLPEALQADLIEYRSSLLQRGMTGLALELELLQETWGAWQGWVDLWRDAPQDLLTWIDPRRIGILTYQKFGLAAVDQLETDFVRDNYQRILPQLQFCGVLMLAFYGVLALLDIWCLPETRPVAWGIRALIGLLIAGMTWVSFKAPFFERYHQLITVVTVALAGFGMILIIALSKPTELGHTTYYAGLHVLIMYINLLSGLRFFPALWVCVALVSSYEAAELLLNQAILTDEVTRLAFISNSFFLISDISFGAVSSNMLKRSERITYMIRYALSHSFKDMLRYFDYESPTKFLNNLSRIRYEPRQLTTFMAETYSSKQVLILPSEPQGGESSLALSAAVVDAPDGAPQPEESTVPNVSQFQHAKQVLIEWWHQLTPSMFWQKTYTPSRGELQALKEEFEQDYFYGAVGSIRAAIIQGATTYFLFAVDDYYCLPETRSLALMIRTFVGIVPLLVLICSFSESFFRQWYQVLTSAATFLAGVGLNAMIALSRPEEMGYATYYGGLIHVMYILFFLCRVHFRYALVIGLMTVASYEAIAVFMQGLLDTPADTAVLLNNSLFLMCALIIGAIACNIIERNNWLDFLTMRVIAYKASELLAYYEAEKPTPRQLLDLISNIRYSPRKLEEYLLEIERMKRGEGQS